MSLQILKLAWFEPGLMHVEALRRHQQPTNLRVETGETDPFNRVRRETQPDGLGSPFTEPEEVLPGTFSDGWKETL